MPIEEDRTSRLVLWAVAAWGAIAAVLTAPFAAGLVGVLFRFPIPFGEPARGLEDILNAIMASVFYLIWGEGVILAGLGGTAGYFIARRFGPGLLRSLALAVSAAFGLALFGGVILAAIG
ncbi:hypothetical protein LTV02_15610 [Nocardia yamanashiensis]|uniref:hypothetical protein n=1 Tax=Nocardia yamanashiensis TaxID=209247 RepID=UPI001E5A5B2F|nr:hypothetical protein [Nocardia yamanashiensis]UGT44727.1 hypothetical protein LTV02_15610 [Nocardia yamanashiensis]